MLYFGAFLAVLFIALTGYLLYKKHNPQAVLLVMGIMMLAIGYYLGVEPIAPQEPTGAVAFDLFKILKETFSSNVARVGLMIMTIGGYVAYMTHIKASDTLVYVSMKPLSLLKKAPYLAAIAIIPIGQLLSITIPSAAGLGLLLAASILPVFVNLGVSRLTAASLISACTVFDMGPGSANTAKAAELLGIDTVTYFIEYQLPLSIPITLVIMILYYFTNRYFDKKDLLKGKQDDQSAMKEDFKVNSPLIYAVLPLLPLAMLIIFSKYVQLFPMVIELDTTTAMFVSLIIAMLFELVRTRSIKVLFAGVKSFWDGMGSMFASVITLIVAAEVYSKGLISLGFINALVDGSTHMGFSGITIGIFITILIFLAATLMGSGNASFFSFGPLVPGIAQKVGMPASELILPMQLSSSMGRTMSPIAGVIVAIAEVAKVSPLELAKRNMIPVTVNLVFMLIYNYIF